jgi:ribulose-phosphate 3-epimerase
MKKISISILSADFTKLNEEIKLAENGGADIIHCDIMDGSFVPNISFGQSIVSQIDKITELPLDVHLMIDEPVKYIKEFAVAGADYISVHYENNNHLDRIINYIKDFDIKAGVALNPATSLNVLKNIYDILDFILIMSVNPGFGGQKFISYTISKINELAKIRNEENYKFLIEVDGGIGLDNIKNVSDAGCDLFVCGASVYKSTNKVDSLRKMKEIIS